MPTTTTSATTTGVTVRLGDILTTTGIGNFLGNELNSVLRIAEDFGLTIAPVAAQPTYLEAQANSAVIFDLLNACPPLSLMHNVYVAGGALRSITAREDIRDVDIFTQNLADAEYVRAVLFDCNYAMVCRTENAWTFTPPSETGYGHQAKPVQVISRVHGTPAQILDLFDFTICQCLLMIRQRETTAENALPIDGKLWKSRRFDDDVAWGRLVYTGKSLTPPTESVIRAFKYERYGYRLTGESMRRLLASVTGDPIEEEDAPLSGPVPGDEEHTDNPGRQPLFLRSLEA